MDWYQKALGAEIMSIIPGPGGQGVVHAQMKIGDSVLMLNDEFPGMSLKSPSTLGGSCVAIHLYVEDVDASFNRAVGAGAKVSMPVMDMFWGDRYAVLEDPFGHTWSLATHKEDVEPEECSRRAEEAFKQMGKGEGCGS
jgi:uncharacterized glyoxalase superfamily protein PhnB